MPIKERRNVVVICHVAVVVAVAGASLPYNA